MLPIILGIIIFSTSNNAYSNDIIHDPTLNPFCNPEIGSFELPIVASLLAENYITTTIGYVSGMPFPLPKPGLINDILIDFKSIAENLIKARSIDLYLGMPFPLPGPGAHAGQAAIKRALHIAIALEDKIDRAFENSSIKHQRT